jgi:cation diffusion facilitator family transporter
MNTDTPANGHAPGHIRPWIESCPRMGNLVGGRVAGLERDMHTTNIAPWQHGHDFSGDCSGAEKRTRRVLVLNAVMMTVEIIGGMKLHSMALYADGWHMATHVTAFIIAVVAYGVARRQAKNAAFTFGTGKVAALGAYTSAIILGAIALFMAGQSVLRYVHPLPIDFNVAIGVACAGLLVNLTSALILRENHHAHSEHPHPHSHHGHHHDLNLKAAYVHVLADAITSLLAILALSGGKWLHWLWLDPAMGLVGAAIITQWAFGLIRDTHFILLDKEPDGADLNVEIRKALEAEPDTVIADLHIWQVAMNKFAAIISVVASHPKPPQAYKELLHGHEELVHVTVEVNMCDSHDMNRAEA